MYAVIMAGGRGTRFWPSSRKAKPKQLLNVFGNETMLQITINRMKKLKCVEDIIIITGEDLAPQIRKTIKGVKSKNIITEPSGKNTAPAIGLAALHIKNINKDAVMGIFPADHLVVGAQKFARAIRSSIQLANKDQKLVTIGINPTYPSTGYGYIQYDMKNAKNHLNGFHVKTFAEKPHEKLAKRFLKSGDFLWNGGMFVWKVKSLFDHLALLMPELNEQLKRIEKRIEIKQDYDNIWKNIKSESIDYGILEKSDDIYVIKAEFEWNDVGSWNSVYDLSPKTKEDNVVRGNGIVLNGERNLVQSENHFTALVGISDLVVVHTEDATLIIPKNKVESIKELVDYLNKNNKKDLL
ncbi:MAG: mannose-1-phosphate guanylyltransferase [Candidatus Marinimicrobia bacterium]|nr:mannose-1-phosphate guanylyltransferase [Candidatus Neomarinimicrobiota bacterium]